MAEVPKLESKKAFAAFPSRQSELMKRIVFMTMVELLEFFEIHSVPLPKDMDPNSMYHMAFNHILEKRGEVSFMTKENLDFWLEKADIAKEAEEYKLAAAKLAPSLCAQWEDGIEGMACLWYWGHFWGRVEIWRMTLHFSEIKYKSMDFTNDEYDALKPLLTEKGLREVVNGPLPMLHIDGVRITETLAACRYIGQTRGLYPDVNDAKAVAKIEQLLTGAQGMFQKLVDHHYGNVNKKAGRKAPATIGDIATHGKAVGTRIVNFFSLIERDYLDSEAGEPKYIMGDKLTIADLFACHYWYIVNQPEFKPLHSPDHPATIFKAYYDRMLSGPIGEYFATRHGSEGAANREKMEAVLQKELRLGHCKELHYPFRW